MDRPLSRQTQVARRMKTLVLGIGLLVALVGLTILLKKILRPSVKRSDIRTARVSRGLVENALTASGFVVPASGEVLTCPINTRVLNVLRRPGEFLKKGDPILELDVSVELLELERLREKKLQKEAVQKSKILESEKTIIILDSELAIKKVTLESVAAKLVRFRRLVSHGLVAKDEVYETELAVKRAQIERRQLERTIANLQETTQADLKAVDLEVALVAKEIRQKEALLEQATARSPRDGVLTWVIEEEGSSLNQGAVLARIADLSRYRVEATISDAYASQLRESMPVRVELGETILAGHIRRIPPAVEKGMVTLRIDLAQPDHELLRSNLRVTVLLVTDAKDQVLRVKNGPFVNGSGIQDIFVIRDYRAHRIEAVFGMSSRDYLEILSGLAEGEEVIISNMEKRLHLPSVDVH